LNESILPTVKILKTINPFKVEIMILQVVGHFHEKKFEGRNFLVGLQ